MLPAQASLLAVSFLLTDMGNGVDRIERPVRLTFDAVVACAALDGCTPLPFPPPLKVVDALDAVLSVLGLLHMRAPDSIAAGFARAVAERQVELVMWLSLL